MNAPNVLLHGNDRLGAAIERRRMLVPVEGWFRGPLLSFARERLLDGLAGFRLFEPRYLERLLDGRIAGLHPRRGVKIWMLVTLESWLRSAQAACKKESPRQSTVVSR